MYERQTVTATVTLTWLDTSKRWLIVAADADGHSVTEYAETTAEVGSAGLRLLAKVVADELEAWLPY
jgi:hypothetical protein